MKSLANLLALGFAFLPLAAPAQTTGPPKGTLVISGGASKYFNPIFERFLELAGGKDVPIVMIPTASSTKPDFDYLNHRQAKYAREKFGLTNLTVLHTHDPAEADTADFVAPLLEARALWFCGGRQWRLVDAYGGTRTEREFNKILERDGVIGGGSAGASIQGSFLVRGDTSGPNVLIGDHQRGFGYIMNSAIDQHLIPRKRQLDLIKILTDPASRMNPGIDRAALLGIGIDEDTAIVVQQSRLEVIGKPTGVVLIYNPRTWKNKTLSPSKYQTLHHGDTYDLKARERTHIPAE